MARVAVLVDAGYLFAQGSAALVGSGQARRLLRLDEQALIAEVRDFALRQADGCSLLRVYWYDGVLPRGPTDEHDRIGLCDNVKLRLGFINSAGQQKGVDSLIVTDLIELARNRAITDAVLLAGDEDIRIGVQVAQSYGVRVHLLGITPARGSQGKLLRQEADTTSEWKKETVTRFLTVLPGLSVPVTATSAATPVQITPSRVIVPERSLSEPKPTLEKCAQDFVAAMAPQDLAIVLDHWNEYSQVTRLVDAKLLATTRDRIQQILGNSEKQTLRTAFIEAVGARCTAESL
jgi:hypothetical protein